jgi:hypothetical protein
MTQCSNCNATLKAGAKFCTNCGTPIKEKDFPIRANDTFHELNEDKPKRPLKRNGILVGLLAIVALFFIVRALVTNIDISRNSLSVSKALTKIEGEWYDPTGELLGDKDAIITFRKRGDVVIGEDKNKALYIQLLAIGNNEYGGLVVLNDNSENFTVNYHPDENKLVFQGNLNKSNWYIKKIN